MIAHNHVMVASVAMRKAVYKEAIRRHGREPFRVSKLGIRIPSSYAGLVIPKESPLRSDFETLTSRLKSAGIIDQMTLSNIGDWREEGKEERLKPISFNHIIVGIFLLAGGLAITIMFFLLERFV